MAPPTRILVLTQPMHCALDSSPYFVKHLAAAWREMGFQVEHVQSPWRRVPADVVHSHVDRTVLPRRHRWSLGRYPRVVNRAVVDIAKSRISGNLMGPHDDYRGPVIVKTDDNCGGSPDAAAHCLDWRRHPVRSLGLVPGKVARRLGAKLRPSDPWRRVRTLRTDDYPVFPSLREVPEGIFANPRLVVEKFLPEMEGEFFCLRYYLFLGDRHVNFRVRSREPIVKSANIDGWEEVPAPPGLHALREKLGFDYGRFDYVVRDGELVLFDANSTPAVFRFRELDLSDELAGRLAGGIRSFV